MHQRNLVLIVGLCVQSLCISNAQTTAPQPPIVLNNAPENAEQLPTQTADGFAPLNRTSAFSPEFDVLSTVKQSYNNLSFNAWTPHRSSAYQSNTPNGAPSDSKRDSDGSVYIPVDSWIYVEMTQLYFLGYVDSMFLSMRPWTRKSVLHMLEESQDKILKGENEEAKEILAVMLRELSNEKQIDGKREAIYGMESAYARAMGVDGTTLRDSFHLGQTIINDYGRPYESGFNSLLGFSTVAEHGRFSLYVRGEYQHSPSGTGYSQALSKQLSNIDGIPYTGSNLNQATIPTGPIAEQNPFRLIEATLSFHLLGHEISGGKSDAWLGPAQGGAMAWSNNAENIYSFRINRVEPLHIPYLSALLGPVRYDFFYGSLKGHTDPNGPYTHSEMFAFRPTSNFEFGFQRTIIFGGEDHAPVTLHLFLKGFFDLNDVSVAEKLSRGDPGARFSSFNFSYRLPFVRNYLTLYADSTTHDDVTSVSAPRRAGWLSGIYLSQFPHVPKLSLRVEGVYTDYPTSRSRFGQANYDEGVQRQGYTNKGFIMGDWISREAKGGQAWVTYHLSGNEWVQLEYLNKKTPKDFIPGGTTQNSFRASVVKRVGQDVELDAWYQFERWKAPIYLPGGQNNSTAAVQVTYFPKLHAITAK